MASASGKYEKEDKEPIVGARLFGGKMALTWTAIVPAAMGNDDDIGSSAFDLNDRLEIAGWGVLLGRELDVAGMLGLGNASRMSRRRHALEDPPDHAGITRHPDLIAPE